MPTPFDQLLEQLKAAQGDTSKLALVTFDFAVANDPLLKEAAIAAAIPHWFDEKTLPALLPEHADQADCLLELVKSLPMVETYDRGTGQPSWNLHEATRLALRERLWLTDPERFKVLSRRAASAYGSADDAAPDFVLTCEHLYHQLAGQTDAGDADMAYLAGSWRAGFRTERLQTLARLVEELLALTPDHPPILPRGRGWCHLAIADARENRQPSPLTVARLQQAEQCFHALAASAAANTEWQRDLSVSLDRLGDLAVAQGDLAGALRRFTQSKTIAESLAAGDPANTVWQRDLSVSLNKLGDLAVAQGDLDGALRRFSASKTITERLAASAPANAAWQRDLIISFERLGDIAREQGDIAKSIAYFKKSRESWAKLNQQDPANTSLQRGITVPLNKLGDLAVSQNDLVGALRNFSECQTIAERLTASDPTNAEWQRDLSVSLNKLGNLAVAQGDLAGALRRFSESKTITEHLAASDPTNAMWQRDLSYSCWVIAAKVFQPQQRWAEALELMEQSLRIDERLAATDPTNVTWQDDVGVSRALVAELRAKAGK